MSLDDALKARTLELISQQMANWVVEIQKNIGRHQESLVRALDDLQENVARYDEKIDEGAIARAIVQVIKENPPPAAPRGPGFDRLKSSLNAIEKGTSLSEVLTYLVNEVSAYVDRAAMFIVKGPSAIGWYGKGMPTPDALKQVNVPLGADTLFRTVQNTRAAVRGRLQDSPGTAQALGRLGGNAKGVLAVPLILREKLAAILYCDTAHDEVPPAEADLIEILVVFAGKIIDMLSAAPKATIAARTTGNMAERAAAIRAGGEEVRERANVPRPPPPPPPPASQGGDEGSSTVMFNASTFASMKQQAPVRPAPPPRPSPAPSGLPPEEQKAHEDAKRFARLVVSEIKLYNEAKVSEGRRQKDLYERLKEDIERGRQMYAERVPGAVRDATNYFYDELVRILAGGDAGALGPM
ncbi:MAG TPA: hypothetical protein VGN09_18965 [Vicinamibacteria bacterium]